MRFSPAEIRRFYHQGYLVIRDAVPQSMIAAARRRINNYIGQNGIDPAQLETYRARSYCPEIREESVLTDLFNHSAVFPCMESLMGEGEVLPAGGSQIALRFPTAPFCDPTAPNGHLDGIGSGANGSARGEYSRGFSALAVVLLNDLPEPDSGNFTVWPGSHHTVEAYLKRHGHEELRNGCPHLCWPSAAVQTTGKAGDVIVTHHQLIHTAAGNTSPNVRYAVIFRVNCRRTQEVGLDALTDIWQEWPPVRAAVGLEGEAK